MVAQEVIDWAAHYAVLALEPGADEMEIKERYRALAMVYHPDKGSGSDEKAFKRVNQAHAILCAPKTADARDRWVFEYRRSKQPPKLRFSQERVSLGAITVGTTKEYSLFVVNDGGTPTGTIDASIDPACDWVAIQPFLGGDDEDHLLTLRILCRPYEGLPAGNRTIAVNVRNLTTTATAYIECEVVSGAATAGHMHGSMRRTPPPPSAPSGGSAGVGLTGSTGSGVSPSKLAPRSGRRQTIVEWSVGLPVFVFAIPHHEAGVNLFGRVAEVVVGGVLDWLEAAIGGWAVLVVLILFVPAAAIGVVYVFLAVLWPVAIAIVAGKWVTAFLIGRS